MSNRPTPDTFGVLIADDHALARKGLRDILQGLDAVEVVGEADTAMATLSATKRLKPDLLLLDVAMPDAAGDAIFSELRRWSPDTKIAIITGVESRGMMAFWLESDALGVILKSSPFQTLQGGLAKLVRGQPFIDPRVYDILGTENGSELPKLTTRERQVLTMLASGKSNVDIAKIIGISPKTAENHRTRLMAKVGANSRAQLITIALREGLLDAYTT